VDILKVSQAHGQYILVRNCEYLSTFRGGHLCIKFCSCLVVSALVADAILYDEELKAQPALHEIMRLNFELYATYTMTEAADEFLASGYISPNQYELLRNQVDRLLAAIRPQAVPLVDGFAIPDYLLNSALGSYDGDVYNRLFDFAAREPLNGITFNTDYKSVLFFVVITPRSAMSEADELTRRDRELTVRSKL
jgi:hypothetical protein